MSHFAEISGSGSGSITYTVTRILVAEQDFINSGAVGSPSNWVQTSYNTHGGVHRLGGTPLRKNYAGIGYTYDRSRDAFISAEPSPSGSGTWVLNGDTCQWEHSG